MQRAQYEHLYRQLHPCRAVPPWHPAPPKPPEPEAAPPVWLRVNTGRLRGRHGLLLSLRGDGTALLRFDGETEQQFPYTKLDLLDADGQPRITPITDMSGRAINPGAMLCYSVPAGTQSHALEIGRVRKLTPSGRITVAPVIHNGAYVADRSDNERMITNPNRALLLPIDDARFMLWLLSDFRRFRDTLAVPITRPGD